MGALVVVQVPQLLAPIVGIGVGTQEIIRPQQQPVRVPCPKACIAASGSALQFNRGGSRQAPPHHGIRDLQISRLALLDRAQRNVRQHHAIEIVGYVDLPATWNV